MRNPEGPSEYLDKHLEPPKPVEESSHGSTDVFLLGPDFSYEYKDTDHLVESYGPVDLRLDYEIISQEDVEDMIKSALRIKTAKKIKELFSVPTYVVTKLELNNSETGAHFQLPSDGIYLLQPSKPADEGFYLDFIVAGDLTKVDGLFTLMHELGHKKQADMRGGIEVIGPRSRLKIGGFVSKEEAASILREERDVSAYALMQIKPFVSRDVLKTLQKQTHDRDLRSYSNTLRQRIVPAWAAWVSRKIHEKISGKKSGQLYKF